MPDSLDERFTAGASREPARGGRPVGQDSSARGGGHATGRAGRVSGCRLPRRSASTKTHMRIYTQNGGEVSDDPVESRHRGRHGSSCPKLPGADRGKEGRLVAVRGSCGPAGRFLGDRRIDLGTQPAPVERRRSAPGRRIGSRAPCGSFWTPMLSAKPSGQDPRRRCSTGSKPRFPQTFSLLPKPWENLFEARGRQGIRPVANDSRNGLIRILPGSSTDAFCHSMAGRLRCGGVSWETATALVAPLPPPMPTSQR